MSVSVDVQVKRGSFDLRTAFEVPVSGFTALFGPSGCGKTTLLRAIAGLEANVRGQVRIGDQVWQDGTLCLPPHRRPIGYVFQQPALFSHLVVADNLRFGMRRRATSPSALAFDQVVEMLGLSAMLARPVCGLSGGESQRVAIGQALLSNPRLLLMDEPLSALDQTSRSLLLPYLDEMQRQLAIPVLYVSHALDEVARLTSHMVLMRAGQVVTSGDINTLLTRLDLPMAHGRNAEAVLHATVCAHDLRDQLSELSFSGGCLWVPKVAASPGEMVRLRVRAHDVSLSLQPPAGSSILNSFPVIVSELRDDGPSQITVRLKVGEENLLARITRRSQRLLAIEPGKTMYAQIKGVALLA